MLFFINIEAVTLVLLILDVFLAEEINNMPLALGFVVLFCKSKCIPVMGML